jgi:hypothetical protein
MQYVHWKIYTCISIPANPEPYANGELPPRFLRSKATIKIQVGLRTRKPLRYSGDGRSPYRSCTPFGFLRKNLKRSCAVVPIRMGSLNHSSPRASNFINLRRFCYCERKPLRLRGFLISYGVPSSVTSILNGSSVINLMISA